MVHRQQTPVRTPEPSETDGSIQDTQLPNRAPLHPVLQLQQSIGNRALQRLVGSRGVTLHPKLTVGAADDHYEQEADRVAQQVVSMPAPAFGVAGQDLIQGQTPEVDDSARTKALASTITPLVQWTPERKESQTKALTERAPSDLQGSFEPAADFEAQLNTGGGGNALPAEVRAFMEPRFGTDFGGVRLHAGSESALSGWRPERHGVERREAVAGTRVDACRAAIRS
jgi:hypothetical protein